MDFGLPLCLAAKNINDKRCHMEINTGNLKNCVRKRIHGSNLFFRHRIRNQRDLFKKRNGKWESSLETNNYRINLKSKLTLTSTGIITG